MDALTPAPVTLAPDVDARIRASFARQGLMRTLDARIVALAPGRCDIELPWSPAVTQQHGYFHGGAIGMLADNAGGYAGYTTIAAGDAALTAEYKLNIMSPGVGDRLVARGRVVRAGRTLIVTTAELFAIRANEERLVALMQQTLCVVHGGEPPEDAPLFTPATAGAR